MCDIYVDNCDKCGREVEMHLGDFETTENELNIYCRGCRESGDKRRGVLWRVGEESSEYTGGFKIGDEVWIIPLTPNAIEYRGQNHPNVGDPVEVVDEFKED